MSNKRSLFNRRDIQPCRADCPNRRPGCHNHCELYIAAREINETRKRIEREKRAVDNVITDCKIRGMRRVHHGKARER